MNQSLGRSLSTVKKIWSNSKYWGWFLILFSLAIGSISVYFGSFVDEADNLVVGWLLTQKFILYRDIFSHHFPFAYYWSALIIGLFGKSIFAVRWSVWLFQIIALFIAMQLSGYYKTIGLTAIIWSVLHTLYRNNQILYNPFAASSLLVIFILIYHVLQNGNHYKWYYYLLVSIYASIALLSDPLSIYAIALGVLILSLKKLKPAILVIAVLFSIIVRYSGYLIFTNSFHDFFEDAIIFNSTIYAKYLNAGPWRFIDLAKFAVTGLGILNIDWFNFNFQYLLTNGISAIDNWIFTGFLYRAGILLTSLSFLLQRGYKYFLYIYLFSCTLLAINTTGFRSTPFILVALAIIFLFISNEGWHAVNGMALHRFTIISKVMLALMLTWLFISSSLYLYHNHSLLSYASQFSAYETDAAQLKQFTCELSGTKIISYPGNSYLYWFMDLKPATKYIFMYPWVADIGTSGVLQDLKTKNELVIVIYRQSMIWDTYDSNVYMRPILEYLHNNYYMINNEVFISPSLHRSCTPTP